jgi:hypothetical protein
VGYVGWGTVVDQANTETGGAAGVVADVTGALSTGLSVAGAGVVNLYTGAPPVPPVPVLGFILLETGFEEYLLQETGSPPTRIQLE